MATQFQDFNLQIDKKRQQGYSDTDILGGLSGKSPEFARKIQLARAKYGDKQFWGEGVDVNNDRDLVNHLSIGYSGKMPTTPSVAQKQPQKQPQKKSFLEKISRGIVGATEAIGTATEFTGIPTAARGAVGALGAGIGGVVGGVLETGKQIGGATLGRGFDVGQIGKSAIKTGAETARFGAFVGGEGAKAAPIAGLGKIPSAIISAPSIYGGIKKVGEGDIRGGTKELAIGALGTFGAIRGKGLLLEKGVIPSSIKKLPAPQPRFITNATKVYREVLRPSASEIKNIEIRNGKNIDDSYRFMAEEGVIIKKTAEDKIDTTDARELLQQKIERPEKLLEARLADNVKKQFDLRCERLTTFQIFLLLKGPTWRMMWPKFLKQKLFHMVVLLMERRLIE